MGKGIGRRAGILLAMSALPGSDGSGALGAEANAFVDFLADAGQGFWQILPIGPVGKSHSPYQSHSAFAGNPAFIDKGLLSKDPDRYAPQGARYERFIRENEAWLDDYALFEAVRASEGGKPLALWPDELRNPDRKTLLSLRERYRTRTEEVKHEQFCFFSQWREFKLYANLKGVDIIGDLPFYLCEDSAEFWLRRGCFDVDGNGRPAASAGVPPDLFTKNGQIWNNPVYNWGKHKKAIFSLWHERLEQAERLYDGVRIDHFRALADYYAIPIEYTPSGERVPAASKGEWRLAPGRPFVDMIRKEYPSLFIIVEDLGELSENAKALVAESGFPGMKVLQFAFTDDPNNPYLPHNIPKNAVVYTGTHDNDTLVGWMTSSPRRERRYAMDYLGHSTPQDLPAAMLAAVLASQADTAIIPLQDWLGLGSEARVNKPGVVNRRNWTWRCPKNALSHNLSARIKRTVKGLYNR